jgi:hypothetical protein
MHRLRPPALHGRTPRPRALQTGGAKPRLEGARLGERGLWELLREANADQRRAPAGVEAFPGQRRVIESGGKAEPRASTLIVPGEQAGASFLSIALPDAADGALRQVEGASDLRQGLALLMQLDDLLPAWERKGAWHGRPPGPQASSEVRTTFKMRRPSGQTFLRMTPAQPYSA